MKLQQSVSLASEHRERATRTERVGEATRERACRGVRGAKPLGSSMDPQWNERNILAKSNGFCAMPLQTGDANPAFGHEPLSRATDHIESSAMFVLPCANETSVFASASVNSSGCTSFDPIMTVTPSRALRPAARI